jgi:hypothetical protein
MQLITLKLVTGEDVIAELESESEKDYVLINPVGIAVLRGKDGNPQIGFSPFPLHAEQKSGFTIALKKRHVVYSYDAATDYVTEYNRIFGSGLVVPPQKQIITG